MDIKHHSDTSGTAALQVFFLRVRWFRMCHLGEVNYTSKKSLPAVSGQSGPRTGLT